jgi:hypothetical protein
MVWLYLCSAIVFRRGVLDMAPKRRQRRGMKSSAKTSVIRDLDRINLRLPPEMFVAMDCARGERPGSVSRNTWITEAIEEKLARDGAGQGVLPEARRRHG